MFSKVSTRGGRQPDWDNVGAKSGVTHLQCHVFQIKKNNHTSDCKNTRQLCHERWAIKKTVDMSLPEEDSQRKCLWNSWEVILFKNLFQINSCFSALCRWLRSTIVLQTVASSWKLLLFVVMNTQSQAGLLQEKSSTAQQVMRFMFPAAATPHCLEINRERIGWSKWKAIANITDQENTVKSCHLENLSHGHVVWMKSDLEKYSGEKKHHSVD